MQCSGPKWVWNRTSHCLNTSPAPRNTPSWPIWAQVASLLSSRHWNPSSRSIPLPPLAPSHTGARVRDPRLQPPSAGPGRCRRPPPCLLLSSPLLYLSSFSLVSGPRAPTCHGQGCRPSTSPGQAGGLIPSKF